MKTSLFLVLTLTSSAFADFSYTSSMTMPGGMGNGPTVTKHYFKGQKMKTETPFNWMIMDYAAGTTTMINLREKTYSVTKISDMAATAGMAKAGADLDQKVDLKETGETKVINGFQTREAVVTTESEVTIPGRAPMKTVMEMHLWIAKDVPGASELKAFYMRTANASGAMMGQGQQRAMAEMQRKIANLGGVPVLTVIKTQTPGMGGMPGMSQGQNAQMSAAMGQARARLEEMAKQGGPQGEAAKQQLARMGGGSPMGGGRGSMDITSEASGFSGAGIPDSVFEIPAGYQKVDLK